jgi:hypothetical protein
MLAMYSFTQTNDGKRQPGATTMSAAQTLIGRTYESESLVRFIIGRVPGAYMVAWTELDNLELRTGRPSTFYAAVLSGSAPASYRWASLSERQG